MRTSLCEMFGIEFPIFAFSHCRDVVAAVSKAGGFGVLGASSITPDQLEIDLKWIEKEIESRPYGVDVVIPAGDKAGVTRTELEKRIPEAHREFVKALLAKYGVPELPPAASHDGSHRHTRADDQFGLVEVALRHPIKLIANALGPPPPQLVEEAHRKGVRVAALVGAKKHALKQVAAGVDLIVAQGYEAAGHTGEIGGMVLIPEVVDAVKPLPVLAAGGIANGRQFAAALALGAQGVWTGSVWLTTEESETHPIVKERFLRATSGDTVRTRSETGRPARVLKSAWTEEWEGVNSPGALPSPLQGLLVAEAWERIEHAASSHEGAQKLINYGVGQVVGSLNQVKPARQVVFEMVDEYLNVAESFADALAAQRT
ncbi:NAD(P)H-dependent flavin oxidoreductase YrpB (nitropropane dioxygenase family) [Bradyrhizobium japonicum]